MLHKGQVISYKGESKCYVDPKEECEEEEQGEEGKGGGEEELHEERKIFMKCMSSKGGIGLDWIGFFSKNQEIILVGLEICPAGKALA